MPIRLTFFALLFSVLPFMTQASVASERQEQSLELMIYNVENLFDIVHDENKEDYTFLPKSHPSKNSGCAKVSSYWYRKECFETDWTQKKLDLKISQIRDVVLKDRKNLPDILAVVEVENSKVLLELANALGYTKHVISNSPDHRGIDVAVMYNPSANLELVESFEYEISGGNFKSHPTRNILEVVFRIGGKADLSLFVNHWPSQASPSAARLVAAQFLKERVQKRVAEGNRVIAVGDFNTIPKDFPHPFNKVLMKQDEHLLYDLHTESYKSLSNREKHERLNGSYYFRPEKTWNLLDRIFFSENLMASKNHDEGPSILLNSYQIYAPNFLLHDVNAFDFLKEVNGAGAVNDVVRVPKRYDFSAESKETAGYSDHLPLLMKMSVE